MFPVSFINLYKTHRFYPNLKKCTFKYISLYMSTIIKFFHSVGLLVQARKLRIFAKFFIRTLLKACSRFFWVS